MIGFFLSLTLSAPAGSYLVENGRPRAEIVIAENSPRATRLAAQELQTYVKKLSGAELRIATAPSGEVPVRVYVGRSSHTDRLGVTDEGLKYGAYRIASGADWLVLIGDDADFAPIEPWPRSYEDIRSGKMQAAWDRITGEHFGYPHSQLRKHYTGATGVFGTADEQDVDADGNVNVWGFDERGSFNAVCGFLRSLGVRWYMPGELGEIVPAAPSIPLPRWPRTGSLEAADAAGLESGLLFDRTVRPDFPLRTVNFRFGVYGRDAAMWAMRLGVRQPYGRQAAHGLHTMTHNEQTLANHPDWFALYGGKRHTQSGQRVNQLCYSNEELLQATVRCVRAQFDHFNMDVVSVMPPDGYTAICQCPLCKGKDSPQRGYRGMLSDYVWEFVNRVAKEAAKTHPNRLISNCAYGAYTLPPERIDKLESNVQVIIVGGRRPTSDSRKERDELRQLRAEWAKKTARPIEIFENYPFTGRGFYLPAYIPRVLGESINETKGVSRGEDIWLTMDFGENAIGFNHFLIYFTARMYWGGKEQNAAEMFDEYCRLFYGPAAGEMRAFFRYCEEHWREMETDGAKANRALELLAAAKRRAAPGHLPQSREATAASGPLGQRSPAAAALDEPPPSDSVYARRIALIDNYLNGLRNKCEQLAQRRGPVPRLRLVGDPQGEIVVDGKLDEELWRTAPTASTGRLVELQTGRRPVFETSFKTVWIGRNLFFAIRCEDHPGEDLNITATKDEDQAIWYGDAVEILLDTESHSYYQIAVNPAGALIDLDRGADRRSWLAWASQAEVATQTAGDCWTVEIRIPVADDKNDPLHQVVGRKPTQSLPWHVNICRQRVRESGSEFSAFSPTGTKGFHEPMKFAHFYRGRSHKFEADPTVADFVIASRAAAEWERKGEHAKALAAYVALAEGDATELQRSVALEQAAAAARALRNFDRAEALADRIPLDAVAKTVRMRNLLEERKAQEVIAQFGGEDIGKWPFWKRGDGCFARGRAYAIVGAGEKAEADLTEALEWTSDRRIRSGIWLALGENRERRLRDDDAALEAYRQVVQPERALGAADEFRAVQGVARILARRGRFDDAVASLSRVDIDKLRGYWRGSMLLALAKTLAAASRNDEALAAYRKAVSDETVIPLHRKAAREAIEAMTGITARP